MCYWDIIIILKYSFPYLRFRGNSILKDWKTKFSTLNLFDVRTSTPDFSDAFYFQYSVFIIDYNISNIPLGFHRRMNKFYDGIISCNRIISVSDIL